MKRILAVLLAIGVIGTNLTVRPYALIGDLQAKQTELASTTLKETQDSSMKDAALLLGKQQDGTLTLSHYINKKTMTKQEFEAFRWSFIFSQFTRPFMDSLDTVFYQDLFLQMDQTGIMLSNVKSALSAVDFGFEQMDGSGMMLEPGRFTDLRDTILNNLYYISLYDDTGKHVTLNDLAFTEKDAGTLYYIYDKVATLPDADSISQLDSVNDLFYKQHLLGSNAESLTPEWESKRIPFLAFNNISVLYLQLAIGAYCTVSDIDIMRFKSDWGHSNLYVDSYGNICTYNGSKYTVVLPNFTNSIFINEATDNGYYEERVYAYNKWLSTVYSSIQRPISKVQADTFSVVCIGDSATGSVTELDDGSKLSVDNGGQSSYLYKYITRPEDKTNLKNRMVFIDPPELTPLAIKDLESKGNANAFTFPYISDIRQRVMTLAHENTPNRIAQATSNSTSIEGFGLGKAYRGIISSPVRAENKDSVNEVGFSGALTYTDEYVNDKIKDKYPMIQYDVGLIKGVGGGSTYSTIPSSFNEILGLKTWTFRGLGTLTSGNINTSTSNETLEDWAKLKYPVSIRLNDKSTRRAPLTIINNTYTLAMSWEYNKTLNLPSYITPVSAGLPRYTANVMFLKEDLLDYGQDMLIYQDEKGMYLPWYQLFYTNTTSNLMNDMFNAFSRLNSSSMTFDGEYVTAVVDGDLSPINIQIKLNQVGVEVSQDGVPVTLSGTKQLSGFLSAFKADPTNQTWTFMDWGTLDFKSYEDFYNKFSEAASIYGLDPDSAMYALSLVAYNKKIDGNFDGVEDSYFLPQYFLLSRDNRISDKLGANTIDDLALTTYFWDRYYMSVKMPFLGEFKDLIFNDSKNVLQRNLTEGRTKWETIIGEQGLTPAQNHLNNPDHYYSNYLTNKDIVLYPFSSTKDSQVLLHYTPHEDIFKMNILNTEDSSAETELDSWTEGDLPNTLIDINYAQLILALQKNTDYTRNYLIKPNIGAKPAKQISMEELMNIAGRFASNPVSSLKDIFGGLVYDIHKLLGTGPLGSAFDLNWLTENSVYRWLIDHYVSILAAITAISIFVRLLQFLFNAKRKDNFIVSFITLLAFSFIPYFTLQGFIWLFDKSGQVILHEVSNKALLYDVELKNKEKINSDIKVDTEIAIFRETFDALDDHYGGITFREVTGVNYLRNEPEYSNRNLTSYIENTKLRLDRRQWYDRDGFVGVNQDLYESSLYYFFYDYLKSSYINYYAQPREGSSSVLYDITNSYTFGETHLGTLSDISRRDLQAKEAALATVKGYFAGMLQDGSYLYGDSIKPENRNKFDKPYLRDLFGFYILFGDPSSLENNDANIYPEIRNSPYWKLWTQRYPLTCNDLLTVNTYREAMGGKNEFMEHYANPDLLSYATSGRDFIYTSVLDAYNPNVNKLYDSDPTQRALNQKLNPPKLTTFEQEIIRLNEDIHKEVVKVLNYVPGQISDETAISIAAFIATCKTNQMFKLEPAQPIMSSINMDKILKVFLLRDLDNMSKHQNLIYGLLDEGYGIIGVITVLLYELASALCAGFQLIYIISIIILIFGWAIIRVAFGNEYHGKLIGVGVISQFSIVLISHIANCLLILLTANIMRFATTPGANGTLTAMKFLVIVILLFVTACLYYLAFNWYYAGLRKLLGDWRNIGGRVALDGLNDLKAKLRIKATNLTTQIKDGVLNFVNSKPQVKELAADIQQGVLTVRSAGNVALSNAKQIFITSAQMVLDRVRHVEGLDYNKMWKDTSNMSNEDLLTGIGNELRKSHQSVTYVNENLMKRTEELGSKLIDKIDTVGNQQNSERRG